MNPEKASVSNQLYSECCSVPQVMNQTRPDSLMVRHVCCTGGSAAIHVGTFQTSLTRVLIHSLMENVIRSYKNLIRIMFSYKIWPFLIRSESLVTSQ